MGYCEYCNELSVSIKDEDFHDERSDCQLKQKALFHSQSLARDCQVPGKKW